MVGPGGSFGDDAYGSSPYGGGTELTVTGAVAINASIVRVTFSDDLDFGNPFALNTSSYVLSPATTVTAVSPAASNAVYLTTSLIFTLFTVTADENISALSDGITLDPNHRTASFYGIAPGGLFNSAATASNRVRLLFGITLQNDAALTNPANYTITSLKGTHIPVASVTAEPTGSSLTLVLSSSMSTTEWYVATVGPSVKAFGGVPIIPSTTKFQYVRPTLRASFPLSKFSGEASGGLLGNPLGLVFFSPALTAAVPNSIIQVDDVRACTRAYDEYTFPAFADPTPLYTYGFGGPGGLLNGAGIVLWAPAPRLSEARTNVDATFTDDVPQATDAMCTAVLQEPWDATYVALLNNPGWTMFDNTGTTVPPTFICADNTAPIPPGGNSIRVLNMPLTAGAEMTAAINAAFGPTAALTTTATLEGTLT